MQQKMMKYMTGFMGLHVLQSGQRAVPVLHRLEPVGPRRTPAAEKEPSRNEDDRGGHDAVIAHNRAATAKRQRQRPQRTAAGKKPAPKKAEALACPTIRTTPSRRSHRAGGAARGMVRLSGPATGKGCQNCFSADGLAVSD